MTKFDFDDNGSRLVEEFNSSAGAVMRRARILDALGVKQGDRILDVGSGPGHQALELSTAVGTSGRVDGVDQASSAIEIARRRCVDRANVTFSIGEATDLPFGDAKFDTVMSSQVFEYLDDVGSALDEVFRVLKPGGRVLIHDTDWATLVWRSSDAGRMARILEVWDHHLADPHLPQSLGRLLRDANCFEVSARPIVQLETCFDAASVSAVLTKAIAGYVVSQGIPQQEADAWAEDLRSQEAKENYYFSLNEYVFTAAKP